jgi:hypothetical protein
MKISKRLLKEIITEEYNMVLLEAAVDSIGSIKKLLEDLEIGKTYAEDPPTKSSGLDALDEKYQQLKDYIESSGLEEDKLYLIPLILAEKTNDGIKIVHKLRTQKLDPKQEAKKAAISYYQKIKSAVAQYDNLVKTDAHRNLHSALTNLINILSGYLKGEGFNADMYKQYSNHLDRVIRSEEDTRTFAFAMG